MLPPGSRAPSIFLTVDYMLNPASVIRRYRARYGDVFRVRTVQVEGVMVCNATLAKDVFSADPDTFGAFNVALESLFGTRSLFSTFGATHRRQRKLLGSPFQGAKVKRFTDSIELVARNHLATWHEAAREGAVVNMLDFGQNVSLDVIMETVFGDGEIDRERTRAIMHELLSGFLPMFVFAEQLRSPWFPPFRRFLKRKERFDDFVKSAIEARRARGDGGSDILGMLLDARYDDGEPLPETEIRDHIVSILAAGHETTAIAIAWAAYWLSKEPRVLAKLREELDGAAGLGAAERLKLPYLGAVCDEVLRVNPIVTDVVRPVHAPFRLGQFTVPEGQCIVVALQGILTDPVLYPDPTAFRPERFLERRFSPSEFAPFGGGHRRCLGAALAESELRTVVAAMASAWNVSLADRTPEKVVRRNVTMGPNRGVRVRVTERAG